MSKIRSALVMSEPALDLPNINVFSIKGLSAQEVNSLVIIPPEKGFDGVRFGDQSWTWPEAHFPSMAPSRRTINFIKPHDLSGHATAALNQTIKLFILLHIFHPIDGRSKLATWQKAQRMLNEFAYSMAYIENVHSFSEISPQAFRRLVESAAKGRIGYTDYLVTYLDDLNHYGRLGLIDDFPGKFFDLDYRLERLSAKKIASSEQGNNLPQFKAQARVYTPFPDQYLSELGRRCDFYLREIGPNLVRIFSNHPDMEANRKRWLPRGRSGGHPTPGSTKKARELAWKVFLANYEWVGNDGAPLTAVPFICEHQVFPPTRQAELLHLVSRHMDALICILLLLSGGRASEVESLQRGTKQFRVEGKADFAVSLIQGTTFKPSPSNGGLERNWPVPREVASWVDNQSAIAAQLGSPQSVSLWFSMSTMHVGVDRIAAHYRCTHFAKRHGLEELAGGSAHPHRFRKTVARLALLALTGAPTLVMVMFGHRDIGTTINYLLSDPGIRDELRQMLGEFRVELGLNIMESLPDSSGPAKKTLQCARDEFFDELKIPPNERSQKVRLLEFVHSKLVEGYFDLKILYPGIICLRAIEQQGLCAKPGSPINTSSCRPNCRHRLELPLRKEEVFSIIEDLLDRVSSPDFQENLLMREWVKNQVIDHLNIFPEVSLHFKSDDRLKKLMASE